MKCKYIHLWGKEDEKEIIFQLNNMVYITNYMDNIEFLPPEITQIEK